MLLTASSSAGCGASANTPTALVAKYAYVANCDDDNVSQYTIGEDGVLTPMSVATVDTGTSPFSIAIVGVRQ